MGPAKWSYFYLYVILDMCSRRVVGWCVADAESATLFIDARYVLVEPGRTTPLTEGTATVVVSYDRSLQRFANTRGRFPSQS